MVTRCLNTGAPENGRRVLFGTRIGDKVLFTCDSGFELQGSAELICQNDGRWSNPVPKCVKGKRACGVVYYSVVYYSVL